MNGHVTLDINDLRRALDRVLLDTVHTLGTTVSLGEPTTGRSLRAACMPLTLTRSS